MTSDKTRPVLSSSVSGFGVRQQQLTLPRRQDTRSSTPSSHRVLRRTPRFQTPSPRPSEPRRVHVEAVSVGISPGPLFATAGDPLRPEQEAKRAPQPRRQLSQDLSDDLEDEEASTLPPSYIPKRLSSSANRPGSGVHPVVRISKHTKSAILWTLEEALRQPNAFSPDFVEENASMADLLAGSGPATSNGNGASPSRPTAPPAQTGSPRQGVPGPRMIMQQRAEREARREAEREQMERIRAEEEARLVEETRRRLAERRAQAAAAAAAAGAATTSGGGGGEMPIDPTAQRRQQRQDTHGTPRIPASVPAPQPAVPATGPAPLRTTRVPTSTQAPQGFSAAPQPGAGGPSTQQVEPSTQAPPRAKNSFPHAFERWEALSAHWEGMTSFWIRKLQENTEELDRNPISSQLSRQVSDLSAAGANLFHAVVELQRLRASSERKFQRWFFETRGELERSQEIGAMMEAQIEEERQRRAEAVREAAYHQRENQKLQKLHAEQRKELLISKEEARRAWEELGRREQEERDRTISLQQGLPTIVGGVQVVPMTQGVSSRHTSTREQRPHGQGADTSEYVAAQSTRYPEYSQAPATHPSSSAGAPINTGHYQQHPEGTGHETASYGANSEAGYSEGDPNSPPRGARGADDGAEDYERPVPTTSYPPSSSQYAGNYPSGPDYSGQDYAAPGWETMPRHHHPTRLSDVIEEDDERSRTSASQLGCRYRGNRISSKRDLKFR
ncbi:hypothetical protein B0T16DRAFT_424533 [Cercophora newfieldiana]|uniref:Uncharacterized protein n=1 Tax=Cercophora newfieldiana TaxID=92897 RepID=A0AA39YNI8_9PEZI|nr:hypothetical protein B0T16DRAFT_424533 [Cercophora newfieldiana]